MNEIITQPWVLLVLALCAGAAVIAATGLWGHKDAQDTAAISAPTTDEVVVQQTMAAPVVIPAAATAEVKPSAVAGSEVSPQSLAPTVANAAPTATLSATPGGSATSTPASMALASPNAVESKPTAIAGMPSAPVSDVVMGFKARQQSVWVKVVDAKGEVRLSRNIAAGERVECGGALPLVVVLGRADSVDVEVRGKPFDFSAFTRDNVARFEVK